MAAKDWMPYIKGTTAGKFLIGIGGYFVKKVTGGLAIRNSADNADAELTASKVNISGNSFVINSDAAGSGSDYKVTVQRASSGMTADVTLTLPVDDGTPNQVLATDGSGVLSWVNAGDTSSSLKYHSETVAYNTSSPASLFSTGASDVVHEVTIHVDTAFDDADATISVGVSGTTSKYLGTTDVDLTSVGAYTVYPGLAAQGAEALIATLSPGSSTQGSVRIETGYMQPAA